MHAIRLHSFCSASFTLAGQLWSCVVPRNRLGTGASGAPRVGPDICYASSRTAAMGIRYASRPRQHSWICTILAPPCRKLLDEYLQLQREARWASRGRSTAGGVGRVPTTTSRAPFTAPRVRVTGRRSWDNHLKLRRMQRHRPNNRLLGECGHSLHRKCRSSLPSLREHALGGAGRGTADNPALEAAQPPRGYRSAGEADGRLVRGEAHSCAARCAAAGGSPATECDGPLGQHAQPHRKADDQGLAQPNYSVGPGTRSGAAVAACPSRADEDLGCLHPVVVGGPGEGLGSTRAADGATARAGNASSRESCAGAEGHPVFDYGCGGRSLRRRRQRGRSNVYRIGRCQHSAGAEETAHDAGGIAWPSPSGRAGWHSQAPQGGCSGQGRTGSGRFVRCGRRWRAGFGLLAPQLGCTSFPTWSRPVARKGIGWLREQPCYAASPRGDFEAEVQAAILDSHAAAGVWDDYKSPLVASLLASIWHLQVDLQGSTIPSNSSAMFPAPFIAEWGFDDECYLKRDKNGLCTGRLCASLHGQSKRVEQVCPGALARLAPSSFTDAEPRESFCEVSDVQMGLLVQRFVHSGDAPGRPAECEALSVCNTSGTEASIYQPLVKGGFCRSFPGCPPPGRVSCLRSASGPRRRFARTVSFNPAVSFWFPEAHQLRLGQTLCPRSYRQNSGRANDHQGPPGALPQAEHVGLRSPLQIHALPCSPGFVPDPACAVPALLNGALPDPLLKVDTSALASCHLPFAAPSHHGVERNAIPELRFAPFLLTGSAECCLPRRGI